MLVAHVSGPLRLQPELCPNSLRQRCCISEETGDWLVCDRIDVNRPNVCSIWDAKNTAYKHHWLKASRRCLDASVTHSHSMCPSHIGAPEEYRLSIVKSELGK